MKIKKIKLLKALALTGAFGIVATVPVIVSACSSTSDNNGGGENNGGGSTQTEKVTPTLKDAVDLKGSLSKIFDSSTETTRKTTNDLIAEDIKANPENYFTNGTDQKVKEAVTEATVKVNGNFSNAKWSGYTYDAESGNWKEGSNTTTIPADNKLLYPTELDQITISSIDGLKDELEKTDVLKNTLTKAGVTTIDDQTTLKINNRLGFTNNDLIHVNVETEKSSTKTQYDLQIPVSDINLSVPSLSIEVTGDNIEASNKTTTKYDFNIGIDPEAHYNQGTTKPTATDEQSVTVNKVLKDLNLATDDNGTLNNEAVIKALGVYNVTFSAQGATIAKKETTARAAVDTVYTITLKATPTANKNYVWADNGNSDQRDISFDVTLAIGN